MTQAQTQTYGFTAGDVVSVLRSVAVGAKNGLSSRDLVRHLCGRTSDGRERYLREIVRQLCDQGFPIMGTPSQGYFWAANTEEINENCKWHHRRAVTALRRIGRLKRLGIPMVSGQLSLLPLESQPKLPDVKAVDYSHPVKVGIVAHIPEELHNLTQQYLNGNDWDVDKLYTTALASFLLQEGILSAADSYHQILQEQEGETNE